MGLFDFLKRKSVSSNTTTAQIVQGINDHVKRYGAVSVNKQLLDSHTHAMLESRFIAFDVETTGLNPSTDRIIELGAVIFENGKPVKTFSSLVNPEINIPASATAVNHITNAMIKSAPRERKIYPEFIEFLGDAISGETLMCAHNASFDFGFLQNTLSRLGFDAEIKYVDTLVLSRKFVPGLTNYKQCTIESYFGLNNSASHRAVTDAEMCGQILFRILGVSQGVVEKERKQFAATIPTQEELEVCAFLMNDLLKRKADVSWVRFRKNSSNYVDITCLYTYLKFKFAKKGKYIIIPEENIIGVNLPIESCTASEGGTDFRRVYFSKPQDLSPFLDYCYVAYLNCYQSMQDYIQQGNYAKREAEQCVRTMKSLTKDEIATLISSAESRDYSESNPSVSVAPTITKDDVVINAINSRCPLKSIKNLNDGDKGFKAGFRYWEKGEVARKTGDFDAAISLFDKARFNGYDAPALYESYAMTYRQLKDYENEIVILDEFLTRNTYGKAGAFEARRDKAILLLYKKQQLEKRVIEKAHFKEDKQVEVRKVKEKAQDQVTPVKAKGRAILQLMDDGSVVQEFETVTAASKAIGVSTKSIRDAAQGVQKHAGGYCWQYKE